MRLVRRSFFRIKIHLILMNCQSIPGCVSRWCITSINRFNIWNWFIAEVKSLQKCSETNQNHLFQIITLQIICFFQKVVYQHHKSCALGWEGKSLLWQKISAVILFFIYDLSNCVKNQHSTSHSIIFDCFSLGNCKVEINIPDKFVFSSSCRHI